MTVGMSIRAKCKRQNWPRDLRKSAVRCRKRNLGCWRMWRSRTTECGVNIVRHSGGRATFGDGVSTQNVEVWSRGGYRRLGRDKAAKPGDDGAG